MAVLEALVPSQALKLEVEVEDEEGVSEVDIGVPSIVTRLQIHWQIEIIKRVRMPLLDHMEQVLLTESHWNILDHYRGQGLDSVQDAMEVDCVISEFRLTIVHGSIVVARYSEARLWGGNKRGLGNLDRWMLLHPSAHHLRHLIIVLSRCKFRIELLEAA